MHFDIVGAGLAGLLAANLLAHRKPTIYEVKPSLPNNHSAVLRFRTAQIGDITRIPFRKVTLIKHTVPFLNPVADALLYSWKNTAQYRSDRSLSNHTTTMIDDRYIAPPNLIQTLARNAQIEFNHPYQFNKGYPIISTIPMPNLMDTLKYPNKPLFTHNSGVNFHAKIKQCDAYVSILVPSPSYPFSRISITGDDLIVECYDKDADLRSTLVSVSDLLGIPFHHLGAFSQHEQKYAKINPIDDDQRKAFMFWATDNFGIYSLGRFATWRPSLLLDDLVKDIRLIDRWIDNKYTMARHR